MRQSGGERLTYERPEIRFWSADELDAIQATMSGGGGGSSGGGGSWSPYSPSGSGSLASTVVYSGRDTYRFRTIYQRGCTAYRYSTAGPDLSSGFTYYTISIAGACAAVLDSQTSGSGANILRTAYVRVDVSGDSRSRLLYSEDAEVFSSPEADGYGSTMSSGMIDVASVLSVCVGKVNQALGNFMSIAAFLASKLFSFASDNMAAESYLYGYHRYNEFAQGIRLVLRVPAESTAATVTITYTVPGESSETDFINIQKSFTVYGR